MTKCNSYRMDTISLGFTGAHIYDIDVEVDKELVFCVLLNLCINSIIYGIWNRNSRRMNDISLGFTGAHIYDIDADVDRELVFYILLNLFIRSISC